MNTLIVAAGRSKRFGFANKLLALVGTRPLIVVTTTRILAATRGPVVLVVGHQSHRLIAALARHGLTSHPRLSIVRSRRARDGLSASLDTALAASPRLDSALTVYLADMPQVAARYDRALAAAIRQGYPVARVHSGHRPGHPIRIHRRALPTDSAPGRLSRAAAAHRGNTFHISVNAAAIHDIDTRQMIRSLI